MTESHLVDLTFPCEGVSDRRSGVPDGSEANAQTCAVSSGGRVSRLPAPAESLPVPDWWSEGDTLALAETANREHRLVVEAATAMLDHAIRAGEALQQIKERCGFGAWGRWLEQQFEGSAWTANFYMRCATYQDELRSRLDHPSLTEARKYLKHRRADGDQARMQPDEDVVSTIVECVGRGMSQREIGRLTGVSRQTVRRYSDPAYRERVAARAAGRPIGRAALASSIRAIAEAEKAGELEALERALRDGAEMLETWAEQIQRRKAAA